MILTAIESAWSWAGVVPEQVLETNAFGNVIVRAADGLVWRICPEELACDVIAQSEPDYRRLEQDRDFEADWAMTAFVEIAERELGSLSDGRCYCLKTPAALGGAYDSSNLSTITIVELIQMAGDIAEQIKDLPDGSQVELVVK